MSGDQNSMPLRTALQDSTNESISGNSGAIAKAVLNDRTGLYLAIIAVVFAAMAFGMAIVLPMVYEARTALVADRAQAAERQAALAREDVRIMQQALAARGIQTDEHQQEKAK